MVHTAVAYARQHDRLLDLGGHDLHRPRLDQHAHRRGAGDDQPAAGAAAARATPSPPGSAPRCCRSSSCRTRPTSRSTTRSGRCRASSTGSTAPSSCPPPLLGAMRVLDRPGRDRRGRRSRCPQDVQAEAYDWPVELFADRVWHVARPPAERVADRGGGGCRALGPPPADRRRRRRPLLRGRERARAFATRPASRSPRPRPARARCCTTTPQLVGAIGSTGTTAANALAREADLVIGVGTR